MSNPVVDRRRTRMITSGIYSLGQITLGLLVHPYQTMQSLVIDKVFVWMSLLPTFVLALLTVGWRWLLVPGVRMVFSCGSSHFWGCNWLPLLSDWITFFCIYWQIMLLYLLFRFASAFRSTKN